MQPRAPRAAAGGAGRRASSRSRSATRRPAAAAVRRREPAAGALGPAGPRQHPAAQPSVRLQLPTSASWIPPANGGARRCSRRCSARCWTARPRRPRARHLPDDSLAIVARARSASRARDGRRRDLVAGAAATPPLRFNDFAVIVPPASAATYLPLAREVFHGRVRPAAHRRSISRRPPRATSSRRWSCCWRCRPGRWAGAICCRSRCTRRWRGRFPDVDPADCSWRCARSWASCAARTARDLADSYPTTTGSAGTRDCGGSRWARSSRAAQRRASARSSRRRQPCCRPSCRRAPSRRRARSAIIARELIDFARTARGGDGAGAAFMALLRRTLAATIHPAGDEEEAALRACFAVLERHRGDRAARRSTSGTRVAAELVRARLARRRAAAGAARPRRHGRGACAPLRALTFRTVFVVGLDERVFPSAQGFGALDLRARGAAAGRRHAARAGRISVPRDAAVGARAAACCPTSAATP